MTILACSKVLCAPKSAKSCRFHLSTPLFCSNDPPLHQLTFFMSSYICVPGEGPSQPPAATASSTHNGSKVYWLTPGQHLAQCTVRSPMVPDSMVFFENRCESMVNAHGAGSKHRREQSKGCCIGLDWIAMGSQRVSMTPAKCFNRAMMADWFCELCRTLMRAVQPRMSEWFWR